MTSATSHNTSFDSNTDAVPSEVILPTNTSRLKEFQVNVDIEPLPSSSVIGSANTSSSLYTPHAYPCDPSVSSSSTVPGAPVSSTSSALPHLSQEARRTSYRAIMAQRLKVKIFLFSKQYL